MPAGHHTLRRAQRHRLDPTTPRNHRHGHRRNGLRRGVEFHPLWHDKDPVSVGDLSRHLGDLARS
ncbi:unnamed protein product [Symbiodinium sp. CCMP2592]|nr:unnamed protein product [Symbiodinium sp. CCMP2592]